MGELESVLPFPHCFQNTQIAKSRAKGAIDDRGPGVPPSNPITSVSIPFQRKLLIPAWTLCRPAPRSARVGIPAQHRASTVSPGGRVPVPKVVQLRLFLPAPPGAQLLQAQRSPADLYPSQPRSTLLRTPGPHQSALLHSPLTSLARQHCLGGWNPGFTGLVGPESDLGAEPGRD